MSCKLPYLNGLMVMNYQIMILLILMRFAPSPHEKSLHLILMTMKIVCVNFNEEAGNKIMQ